MVGGDIIVGNFFIVSTGDDGEFKSLTGEQIKYTLKRFDAVEAYTPEQVEEKQVVNFFSFDDENIDRMLDQTAAKSKLRRGN
jgi:hypothetical protein